MSWLNYHHLMYFKTIASEGSISKASEKLMVGQPALSAQLKQLEESFDQKLFDRKNRRLILTDAGKAALKYANQIFSLGSELQEVLSDKSFSVRPHISIGSLDSVPKNLTVKLIEAARKIRSSHVMALDGSGDSLYRQLSTHAIDIMLANYPVMPADDASVYSRSIGRFPIYIYASPKWAHLKKNFPHSMMSQPIILPTTHSKLRHDIDQFFQLHEVYPEVVAETQDTIVQKLLASDGVGLIAEPAFAVKKHVQSKELIRIGALKGVFEEFFLTTAKRSVENPVATELMRKFSLQMR